MNFGEQLEDMLEIKQQVKYTAVWIIIFMVCLFVGALISLLLKIIITDSNYREIRYYFGFLAYSLIPIICCKTYTRNINLLELLHRKRLVTNYLFGGLIGFVACAICLRCMLFFGKITVVRENNVNVILMFAYIFVLVIQGFGEEVLFRGMLLRIYKGYPIRSVVISSLFFSLAHIFTPNTNVYTVINIFLIGCFLAIMTITTNGLWFASGFHALYNLTMTIGISLNTKYHYGHAFFYAENMSGNIMFDYLEGNYFNTIIFCILFFGCFSIICLKDKERVVRKF